MWLLILIFFITTLLLSWCFFGYFLFIWFIGLFRRNKKPEIPVDLPALSVVIPCFNEEGRITAKLDNIRSLDYPKHLLEVYFVDGGSSDGTLRLLSSSIKGDEQCYKVVQCPEAGKIKQLNYILPRLKGDIIVNTDVDAQLSSDALKWITAEFGVNKDIAVVGAYARPKAAIEIEKYYWSSQNKSRFLENDALGSSIVIAQCYAFRRGFLRGFPEDAVADDVYVAFLAHSRNNIVVYSRYATTFETRCPKTYSEFLPHKFRKSNAFLRESLRFIYLLPQMNAFCKMMFMTKIFQQLLLPWALLFWFLLAGVILTLFRYDILLLTFIALTALFILTSRVFTSVRLPDGHQRYSIFTIVKGYFLALTIMLATGASYPFFKQESTYPRLKAVYNE